MMSVAGRAPWRLGARAVVLAALIATLLLSASAVAALAEPAGTASGAEARSAVDGHRPVPSQASVTAVDAPTVQAGGYSDVGSGHFAAQQIAALADAGVFEGTDCASGRFCPDETLPRWIMAVWLVRVLDGREPAAAQASRFADVDVGDWWVAHTERFAMLQVTKGCAVTPLALYCPDESVDRGQMAAFLVRGFDLAEAPSAGFADTAGSFFESDIDALATAGITAGCETGPPALYCPDAQVTRAQMAVFIHRALYPQALPSDGAPRVALESAAPLVLDGPFGLTIRFDQPVTGLSRSEMIVANGRATSLEGGGAVYNAVIEPAADGSVMVRIPAGAAQGSDGRANEESAPFVRRRASTVRSKPPGIDTWNRPVVQSSSSLEFGREDPDWGFTGNLDACVAGTTSQELRNSVIQRVNWYRQMGGMGTVRENPELSADAQQTALMMLAKDELSHYPGRDWPCHSDVGAATAAKSNLGLGNAGVAGIDDYIRDHGDNNLPVGHRRWILYPQIREMGTGNMRHQPGGSTWTANALEVTSGDRLSRRPDVREERGFVAWPPPGYLPAQTVWGRWSFSLADADFSNATVTMADDSGAVQVELLDRDSDIGEPTIVWAVAGDTNSTLLAAPADGDHCYAVTVSGVTVKGTAQTPYEYATCVIDPDAPTGPSVTVSSDATGSVGGTFDVDIAFSEPVAGFTRDDVFAINGAVQALTGSGRDYTATIRADDNGWVTVTVGTGAVHDRHSRPNTAAVPLRVDARVGRPGVSMTSAAGRTVNGSFDVDITFTEPVTGFSPSGLEVVNGEATGFGGSGASYWATIRPDAAGTVAVRVLKDAATGPNGRRNAGTGLLTRLNTASGGRTRPGIDTWRRGSVIRALEDSGFDEPDWGYTGDVSSCIAGTTSQAFRSNVLERLNWYRTMAGLSPVAEDTTDSSAARMAALLFIANDSFDFSRSSRCYSQTGDEASQNGLKWLGRAGIRAIDGSMESAGTLDNRHNLLSPWLAEVGIGHARAPDSRYRVSHMLHTDYNNPWNDPRPAVREERRFVAWPPSGHVIDDAVWDKWSFSLPDADFSAATVSVIDHHGPLHVTVLGTVSWYREQSLHWSISPPANSATRPKPRGHDHCYTVTVSGVRINGSPQTPYQYAVCIIETAP